MDPPCAWVGRGGVRVDITTHFDMQQGATRSLEEALECLNPASTCSSRVDVRILQCIHGYIENPGVYRLDHFRARCDVPEVLFRKLRWDVSLMAMSMKSMVHTTWKRGIGSEVRIFACLRIWGTSRSFHGMEYYAQMGRQTIQSYLYRSCRYIIHIDDPKCI